MKQLTIEDKRELLAELKAETAWSPPGSVIEQLEAEIKAAGPQRRKSNQYSKIRPETRNRAQRAARAARMSGKAK